VPPKLTSPGSARKRRVMERRGSCGSGSVML
jgi:hypothetical protein